VNRWLLPWLVVAPLLVGGTLASAQVENTGWRRATANSGQFTNPTRAYTDGVGFATALDGQEHRYWGYGISIPSGNRVVGIQVVVDARRDGTRHSALYVELSWDGGVSWTTTGYFAGWMPTSWRQYFLGGASDTWGRTWTAAELADGGFRVRLRAVEASRLDWVTVRVHFQPEIALALTVTPQLVDLGTLTLAHYDAGFRELSPAQRITVSSPASWSLHVAANAATWAYTGSEPPPGKPCSHLEWRVSAFGSGITGPQTTYLGLTTGLQWVAGGTAGTGLWLDIALRVLVDYTFTVPGTYTLAFTFTLTSP